MTDWKKIFDNELTEPERDSLRAFLARADDDDTHEHLTLHTAGGWVPQCSEEPVTLDHCVSFLASLVDVRAGHNSRLDWRMLLELIAPDEDAKKLLALYERETGVTDDQAFPAHLDPDEPEGWEVAERLAREQARLVEEHQQERRDYLEAMRIRREDEAERVREAQARRNARRPAVLAADPSRQFNFGFPQVAPPPVAPPRWRNKERPVIERLMAAWLHDGRPSPIVSYICTGRRGRLVWALVRVFDGGRALIVFEDENADARGAAPWMRYRGRDFDYCSATHEWERL